MSIREEIEQIVSKFMPARYEGTPAAASAADQILELFPPELRKGWMESNERMRHAILEIIAPKVLALWAEKNKDYAGQQVFLGMRAQFADINRKFWKLKQVMWDDEDSSFEKADEIMMDMIGHLLMSIFFWRASGRNCGPIGQGAEFEDFCACGCNAYDNDCGCGRHRRWLWSQTDPERPEETVCG